jgi:type I restriction enzyme S subunit
MSDKRWPIPKSWKWVTINDIAIVIGGGTPSSKIDTNFAENGIAWVTPADLAGYSNAYISRGRRDLSNLGYASSSAILMPIGTVLYSTRAPIGYCVIAENEISTNQGFKNLILKGNIDPEYIRYYLLSAKEYAESMASGTTFLELSGQRIKELLVPIAPLPEQKFISKKINILVTRSSRAQRELNCIPILIEKYKNKILSDAYLRNSTSTEKIRKENFRSLEDICITVTDGDHQAPPRADEGIPFITISNMNTGYINIEQATRFVPLNYYNELKPARKAEKDDVLFSVTGSVGIPALVRENTPFVFQRHIAILKPKQEIVLSEYLYYILAAPQIMEQVLSVATGSAQLTVPLSGLRKFKIPIPPLNEQKKIVEHIKSSFAWIEHISDEQKAAIELLPKLDAAILSKAFQGKLVPQDPNDEPASQLMARIEAEKDFNSLLPKQKKRVFKKAKEVVPMEGVLSYVLAETDDWLPAQEVFRRCGVIDGTHTEQIEELYAELRKLDKEGRLLTEPVKDEQGRKLYDLLKLRRN